MLVRTGSELMTHDSQSCSFLIACLSAMMEQASWSLLFILFLYVRVVIGIQVLLGTCHVGAGVRQITVQDLTHLPQPNRSSICSMQIFNSGTSTLQDGVFLRFTGLLTLSFYNNDIQNISANAFQGLTDLRSLNLSMNPIQVWQTSHLISQVPNLTTLDLNGTSWIPDNGILRGKQLRTIHGVSWGQHCRDCSLVKSNNSSQLRLFTKGSTKYIKGYACRTTTVTPTQTVQRFAKHGFLATCVVENLKCRQSEMQEVVRAPCRDTTLSVLYPQYLLGPLAIVLNLVVIIITMSSKRLRQNIDMLLVCNIGVGDLLNGVYSILIISVHTFHTFDQMMAFASKYCAAIGSFWVLGVCLAVGFAFVLTIERYKCVVCSRPRHRKMSPTTLLVASAICWLWALTATVLPMVGVGSYSLNTYCISVFPVKSNPVQFYYSILLAGLSALLYLATLPMYVKMYIFVRRSSKNMRVRADIELAKRVFSLVLTNMLFLLLPIVISLIFASAVERETNALSREVSEVLNASFPLVCLTLNSVFNPILYAYRSRLFRTEFVRLLSCKGHKTCPTHLKLYHVRAAYVVQSPNNSTSLVTL